MTKSSREIFKLLKADGWYINRTTGDHFQFKHLTKPGTVTVRHPVKDLNLNNIKSIEKQAGIKII